MLRRAFISVALLGLLLGAGCRSEKAASPPGPQRIISLSPPITETLFAIGAGDVVVGVTDFCDYPATVKQRTKTGSILQPNYEVIARLQPTLILGEQVKNSPEDKLRALAETRVLPWLSTAQAEASTIELGKLTHHEKEAAVIVDQLKTKLQPRATEKSPRVLLVIAGAPGQFGEVWYVKRQSLHGTVLEAAGAQNAVTEDVSSPVLSIEKLLAVDPDAVVVLVPADQIDAATQQKYLDGWKALPTLKAVKNNTVHVLVGMDVQSTGPRILSLADRLTALVQKLGAAP